MTSQKARKPTVQLAESLPEYLGLGLLDPHSVKIAPHRMTARYTIEGDMLYHVTLRDKHFQIEEFLDGELVDTTTQPTSLQDAFFRHLLKQLPYNNRRYERLYHRLQDGRNVLVEFATEPRFFYFPAGYLFTLRQPVVGGNQALFDQIAPSADGGPDRAGLSLEVVRKGVVLRLLANGDVTVEPVRVADFSAALHRVTEAVDRLWHSGVVPPEKEYQLAVMDSSLNTAGNLTIYLGDMARGIAAFSVVVTEGTKWTMEKLQNDFGAGACQLLENLKK